MSAPVQAATPRPARHVASRTPYRDVPTAKLLEERELWAWDLADVEVNAADWEHADASRTLILSFLEDLDAQIARRERLRHHPAAPAWPKDSPDRRAELEEIKRRIDLADLVHRIAPVHLIGHGNRRRCKCPLPGHEDDNDPSFVIYVDQQRFYCFGCNRGGDCFEFVRLYIGFSSFGGAVDFLAGEAGVERSRPRHPAAGGGRRPRVRVGSMRVG